MLMNSEQNPERSVATKAQSGDFAGQKNILKLHRLHFINPFPHTFNIPIHKSGNI